MKKIIAFLLVLVMMLSIAACAPTTTENPGTSSSAPAGNAPTGVMTHAQYMAAEKDAPVEIEAYVQATQSWWDNKIVVYAMDKSYGGYFAYNLSCTEEEAAKLTPGTKINIKGFKTFYKGMPEVADGATFTFVEGADSFVATAEDVTALLGKDELVNKAGMLAAFKGMKVEPIKNADGVESAFLYNWDGSGQQGSDLYFNVSVNGATYNFCVESYLCGKDTDVYKAVEALQIGDVIDLEGFVYWYDGINPHITAVTPAA